MAQDSEYDDVRRQIDDNLKRVYQEKVEEELPERFRNLLQQLKAKEPKSGDQQ
ncbi:regulator [Oceanicola sp. 22II-s10i]|uniref:NepR family anti-sigma factor n=1 Tax=Oceanicola sp. 22II-s10i TaxID=1317116 RepID=UPI000B525883|nr:NepR family anti-sigma factor [Oceanicola sp. 22II-s10i]OWU85538.1 regulator [Oceanicola sp. 22II-s10i]